MPRPRSFRLFQLNFTAIALSIASTQLSPPDESAGEPQTSAKPCQECCWWFLLFGEQQEEVDAPAAAVLAGEASEEATASDASPSANEMERP